MEVHIKQYTCFDYCGQIWVMVFSEFDSYSEKIESRFSLTHIMSKRKSRLMILIENMIDRTGWSTGNNFYKNTDDTR